MGGGGGGGPGGEGGDGGGGGGEGGSKLAKPGASKSRIMSVTVTYKKKTAKYWHIFSGPRAGLWLKKQLVGTRRKRMLIRPTDLPVLVFHHRNCIQGFASQMCRFCFRLKSRAGLMWTPIGHKPMVKLGNYKLKSPKWVVMHSPKGGKDRKYKAVRFIKPGGMAGPQNFFHFIQGPDAGTWYRQTQMGFGKVNFAKKYKGVYMNYDCKMGLRKRVCRDCFSFGPASTAVAGGGMAPEDAAGSDGPEIAAGYTPKFTFGKDTPRCGVKMCRNKGYTKCLWVYYDKCFKKSSLDKAVKSFQNSGKCPFTVYADCKKKTKKGQFYPGDKKQYSSKRPWRKIAFGSCAAKVCAKANYKSCKTVITNKCISAMGIKQIMSVKNLGMCPFVLHQKCSYGGNRYPVLPLEKKNWGKKAPYKSLKFTGPTAKVCKKKSYKSCETVDSNRFCLSGEKINDAIVSVYNYAPALMTLYKNCKFDGTSKTLIPGQKKDWKSKQNFSSIKFTPCVARVCKKNKFTSCVTITNSVTCLKEVKMNDKVASVINSGSCKLTLYKKCTGGKSDTLGPGQARIYGNPKKASWSAVKWTEPTSAPLDWGYWIAHPDDDDPPPGAPFLHNNLNHIPLLNNEKYGVCLPDTTIKKGKIIYHDKLSKKVNLQKIWFHDDTNNVIRLAANTNYCIALTKTSIKKDQDLQLKKCAKNKYDQWTYDSSTRQIKLKANTKRCMKKAKSGNKKCKVRLLKCSSSGDKKDKWGVKKPPAGPSAQMTSKGKIPWKFENKYCMAAKSAPKKKGINIVFKKYKGNTQDQWHYNKKHYTINSNKYPTIVMRVSGSIKAGTPIKTAVRKRDKKDQWVFDATNFLIKLKSNTKYCMMKKKAGYTVGVNVVLGKCGTGSTKEKWGIEEVFTMKSASVTDVKIMKKSHSMWPMKFGSHSHTPVRIKYVKGSTTHILYYNFVTPSGIKSAKCKKKVTCGHLNKWYYINGSKTDRTKGKNGKKIGVAKREWIHFPLKVSFTKKSGKYMVRLDCNKCK